MRTRAARVVTVIAACAVLSPIASAQMDPALRPGSPGAVGVDPHESGIAPEHWQLARLEVIAGQVYYVVDHADAYIRQVGWDIEKLTVHRREDTGLAKDLILAPDQGLRPQEPGRARDMRAKAPKKPVVVPYRVVRRPRLDGVRHRGGWKPSRGRPAAPSTGPKPDRRVIPMPEILNVREVGPIEGQFVPGYADEVVPIVRGDVVLDSAGNEVIVSDVSEFTASELARLEHGVGNPRAAAELYREHLVSFPDDFAAMRLLGVSLFQAGTPAEGARTVLEAYQADPTLAGEPLELWIAGDSVPAFRKLSSEAARHAQRAETPGARLLFATLLQAQGHRGPALRQIELARELGLDGEIALRMREAMLPDLDPDPDPKSGDRTGR